MPCYLKDVATVKVDLKAVIKSKGKVPTKDELKAGLRVLLQQKKITPVKFSELVRKIDACVEQKGHVHDHVHEGW
jgi:hypothetical protein